MLDIRRTQTPVSVAEILSLGSGWAVNSTAALKSCARKVKTLIWPLASWTGFEEGPGMSAGRCPELTCREVHGTSLLHYLLCKACHCELFFLVDKPWVAKGKTQLLVWVLSLLLWGAVRGKKTAERWPYSHHGLQRKQAAVQEKGWNSLPPSRGRESLHQRGFLRALARKCSCIGKCCPSLLTFGRKKSLRLPLLPH